MKQQESQMKCAKWKKFSRQEYWSGVPSPSPEDRHSLLQRIFPILGLNPGLPHCRLILYRLSQQGSSSERYQTVKLYTVWFHLYVTLEKSKLSRKDRDQYLSEVESGERWLKNMSKCSSVIAKFYIFILVMITWMCGLLKIRETISLKRVNFNVWKFFKNS